MKDEHMAMNPANGDIDSIDNFKIYFSSSFEKLKLDGIAQESDEQDMWKIFSNKLIDVVKDKDGNWVPELETMTIPDLGF